MKVCFRMFFKIIGLPFPTTRIGTSFELKPNIINYQIWGLLFSSLHTPNPESKDQLMDSP